MTTINEFLESIRNSGILAAEQVDELEKSARELEPASGATDLASALVERNVMTRFQADQLLSGLETQLRLGHYILEEMIGEGGMGRIYRARHAIMKRQVAVKVLPPDALDSDDSTSRFEREVEAAAQLNHMNIVTTYDAGNVGDVRFLVMEYIEGVDLHQLVKDQGPLALETALDYLLQAARGLKYLHEQQMVHRDVKPSNLMLDDKNVVKVLDVGLAKMGSAQGHATTAPRLTATGDVMGTVDFMAPEQARNIHSADQRADIYSLGCTWFYLLTGNRLYAGSSLMERIRAHQKQPIPKLRDTRPELPRDLDLILPRLVAKRPEDRFQSMDELIDCLEEIAQRLNAADGSGAASGSESTTGRPPGLVRRPGLQRPISWRPARLVIPVAILVAAIGLTWAGVTGKGWFGTNKPSADANPQTLSNGRATRPPATEPTAPDSGPDVKQQEDAKPPLPAEVDRAAAQWVLEAGGQVSVLIDGNEQAVPLASNLPDAPFQLVEVNLSPLEVSDDDLARLSSAVNVSRFNVYGCPNISDSGLAHLRDWTKLTYLSVGDTQITETGLAFLSKNADLNQLIATNFRGSSAVMEVISGFARLQSLNLTGPNVTDQSFAALAQLPELAWLGLQPRPFTAELIAILKTFPALTGMTIYGPRSPTELKQLAELPHLTSFRWVNADETDPPTQGVAALTTIEYLLLKAGQVDDSFVAPIRNLGNLRRLELLETSVTADAVLAIKDAIPELTVNYDSSAFDGVHRRAAEWVVEQGGAVYVQTTSGVASTVQRGQPLPAGSIRVVTVDLRDNRQLTDADLVRFSDLYTMTSLQLARTNISNDGIAHLDRLWNLRNVNLASTRVGNGVVELLRRATHLGDLSIRNTDVRGAELATIARFRHLTSLDIAGTLATDQQLSQLKSLKKLETLAAWGTQLTSNATDTLIELPELQTVHFSNIPFGGERLDELAALKKLETLSLYARVVTPEQLSSLAAFPSLRSVGLDSATDEHLTAVAALDNVEELTLGPGNYTEDGIHALADAQELKELYLWRRVLSEGDVDAIASLEHTEQIHLAEVNMLKSEWERLKSLMGDRKLLRSGDNVDLEEHRAIAEWVIGRGGSVWIRSPRDSAQRVSDPAQLPDTAFALTGIHLGGDSALVDEDLARIERIGTLNLLQIFGTGITGSRLSAPGTLRSVYAYGAPITDAGLAQIAANAQLEALDVYGAPITDSGLRVLRQLSRLRHLVIGGTQVGPSVPSVIQNMTRLSLFTPGYTLIENDTLAALADKTELIYLNVDNTRVSGDGLVALYQLPKLSIVRLLGTDVSADDVRAFKQAAPTCNIIHPSIPISERPDVRAVVAAVRQGGSAVVDRYFGPSVTVKSESELPAEVFLIRELRFPAGDTSPAVDLAPFEGLRALTRVSIEARDIDASQFQRLASCPLLEHLSMTDVMLTLAHADTLGGLPHLRSLTVGPGVLTDEVRARLIERRPQLRIHGL